MNNVKSNVASSNRNKAIKTAQLFAVLALALSASASWAQGRTPAPSNNPIFEVEVLCEDDFGLVAMTEEASDSVLIIGSVGREGAEAEPTTQLLRSETRQWIASEIMSREGMLRDDSPDHDLQFEGSSCLTPTGPGVSEAQVGCVDYLGMCTCYPDDEGDCSLFFAICGATGGTAGHNICTW